MDLLIQKLYGLTITNLNSIVGNFGIVKKGTKKYDLVYDIYKNIHVNPQNIKKIEDYISQNNMNISYIKNMKYFVNNKSENNLFFYINKFNFETSNDIYFEPLINDKSKVMSKYKYYNKIFILSNCISKQLFNTDTFLQKLSVFLSNEFVYVILTNLSICNDKIINFCQTNKKIFYIAPEESFVLNSISPYSNIFYSFGNAVPVKTITYSIHFKFNTNEQVVNKNICNLNLNLSFNDCLTSKNPLKKKEFLYIACVNDSILHSTIEIERKAVQLFGNAYEIDDMVKINKYPVSEIYYYGEKPNVSGTKLTKIDYKTPLDLFEKELIDNINQEFVNNKILFYIGKTDKEIEKFKEIIFEIDPKFEFNHKSKEIVDIISSTVKYKEKLIKYIKKQTEIYHKKLQIINVQIINYKGMNKKYTINDKNMSVDVIDAIIFGIYGFNKIHPKFMKKNFLTKDSENITGIAVELKINTDTIIINRSFSPKITVEIKKNDVTVSNNDKWINDNLISVEAFINFYTLTKGLIKSSSMNDLIYDKFFKSHIKEHRKFIKDDIKILENSDDALKKTVINNLKNKITEYMNILICNVIFETKKHNYINQITLEKNQVLTYKNQWLVNNVPIINVPIGEFYKIHFELIEFYRKIVKQSFILVDINIEKQGFIYFQ